MLLVWKTMFALGVFWGVLFNFGLNIYAETMEEPDEKKFGNAKVEFITNKKNIGYGNTAENTDLINSINLGHFNGEEEHKLLIAKKYFNQLDNANKESWIDPYDMLSYNPRSLDAVDVGFQRGVIKNKIGKQIEGKTSTTDSEFHYSKLLRNDISRSFTNGLQVSYNNAKENDCVQHADVFLNRWLKIFLNKVNFESGMKMEELRIVKVAVTNRELFVLQDLLDFQSIDLVNVDKIVSKIFSSAEVYSVRNSWWRTITEFVTSRECVICGNIIIALISLCILYHNFIKYPIKTSFAFIVMTSFVTSWYNMYQKKVAEKYATLDSIDYPKECHKENLGFFYSVASYVKGYFFDIGDNCVKYHEAQMVDPIFKVSPAMAMSEALTNMVFQPLGPMGNHLNAFVKEFFSGLPLTMIATSSVFAITVMIIIYKIRLSYSFTSQKPCVCIHSSDRTRDNPQNAIDGNIRQPVIEICETPRREEQIVQICHLQVKVTSQTEMNKLTDSSASLPELTINKSEDNVDSSTVNCIIHSAGDCSNIGNGKNFTNCSLCNKQNEHSVTDSLQGINDKKNCDEKLINHPYLEEIPFDDSRQKLNVTEPAFRIG